MAELRVEKKTKRKNETLLRKLKRYFKRSKPLAKENFGKKTFETLCFLLIIFLNVFMWLKAHFVRAGQALHTQRQKEVITFKIVFLG